MNSCQEQQSREIVSFLALSFVLRQPSTKEIIIVLCNMKKKKKRLTECDAINPNAWKMWAIFEGKRYQEARVRRKSEKSERKTNGKSAVLLRFYAHTKNIRASVSTYTSNTEDKPFIVVDCKIIKRERKRANKWTNDNREQTIGWLSTSHESNTKIKTLKKKKMMTMKTKRRKKNNVFLLLLMLLFVPSERQKEQTFAWIASIRWCTEWLLCQHTNVRHIRWI